MNCIEIIQLRASGVTEADQASAMVREIHQQPWHPCRYDREHPDSWKILRNSVCETDLCLHLHWKSEEHFLKPSTFGLRLARALEEYGIINHSIWQET